MLPRHEERVEAVERGVRRRDEGVIDLPVQGWMRRPDRLTRERAARHGVEHGLGVPGEETDQFPANVAGAVEQSDVGGICCGRRKGVRRLRHSLE
jgi:hypothetical protein